MTQVKNHSGVFSPCFYTISKCPEHWEKFGTQVNQKVKFPAGDYSVGPSLPMVQVR